ncbi:50S ribosomal protein L24 [Candidatus Paracaedibacter symbiosus]|uniref:50S ribosomal protein L24 n=1 Tax=Candidatus Paracaedibacter symbiosus TaxID=244582 RepID=UPI000509D628|nr:50S ribosomal protein L24 [Candidatus Paracaedibacter symbiosus]
MTVVKFKIKKGDRVIVRTGGDKGKIGTVLKVLSKTSSLLVEGVKIVKRHTKPTQMSAGGIIEKETKIHISNVALIDPRDNTATKVGYKILEDGSKVRFAKKSGDNI